MPNRHPRAVQQRRLLAIGPSADLRWGRDLKDVVQEHLFDAIGIPYERWDWLAGGAVKERKYLYPTIPDAYTYLDPTLRDRRPSRAQRSGLGRHQRLGPSALRPPQCHPRYMEGDARHRRRLPARPRGAIRAGQRRVRTLHSHGRGNDDRAARVQSRGRDQEHPPRRLLRRTSRAEFPKKLAEKLSGGIL